MLHRGEYPLVAVAQSGSVHPALVAVVPESLYDAEGEIGVGHVELAAEKVRGDEVTVESLAEPESGLGLNHPLFLLAVVGEVPCVIVPGEVDRSFGRDRSLHTQIDGGCRIGKEIGLHRQLLRVQGGSEHSIVAIVMTNRVRIRCVIPINLFACRTRCPSLARRGRNFLRFS